MASQNKTEEKPKAKSTWSKLRSLVYEEDTTAENNEETSPTPAVTENTPSKFSYSEASKNTNMNISMPGANGVFDQKFYDSFLQIIEDNNIEGIDYCEFSKAKKANDNIPGFSEALKFQSAFHTLKANYPALTKDTLLKTADFYLGKLDDEEKNFSSEMKNEINSQVSSKLGQAKDKQDEIAKKQEEIVKLQAEMGTLQTEIGSLSNEAQQVQMKIDATAKNFKVSLEVLKAQIAQDKQSIQNFIQ